MPDKKTEPTQPVRLKEVSAGKALAFDGEGKSLREGTKPSAPANLVLPKPVAIPAPANLVLPKSVAIPAPAASNNEKSSEKK